MSQLYRVHFISGEKSYELYVKSIKQGSLFGFVELGEFVFDTHAQVLVDPAEEKLKSEFKGVSSTYVPMHNVIRIDAVDKLGSAKIHDSANVTAFPKPIYTPKA